MRQLKLVTSDIQEPGLTVGRAAEILNRSATWVRNRITTGFLERDSASTPKRVLVSARSVAWAQGSMDVKRPAGPKIRLVVDNDSKPIR